MKFKTLKTIFALTAFLSLGSLSANAVDPMAVDWFTIDGGGVVNSTTGSISLSGTIGQPDAGTLSGGAFTLNGGFWYGEQPSCGSPDTNGDGCVNDFDLANVIFDFGGPPSGSNGNSDVVCSGMVDDFDLAEVIFAFGTGCNL